MKYVILIIIMALSINAFSQVGGKNFIDQHYIEVTGKAEMEVIPDEIFLKIIIDETDFKNKVLEDVEKIMLDKLVGIGIDTSNDLVIKDMASNFKNYWLKGSEISSSKEYQLLVHDTRTAGLVFQELESIKISNILIEKIKHSEILKYRREVKILAIKAAKEKASSLTNAIDQKIGKAIHIQELNYQGQQRQLSGLSNILVRHNASIKEIGQEIKFEKIKLEYSILARFEISD